MKNLKNKIYLNLAQQLAYLIHPWSYYGVLGRGAGKSVGILSLRSSRLCYEMSRASFGFYANTYLNAMSNLIPNIIAGWKMLGYIENYHFTVDKKPPDHFNDPFFKPLTYKHTITWHTGTIFHIISDDRPSSARGRSLQHLFGDEIKLINYENMKKAVFPAIRGERIHFANVPQFQGFTFTTDMPGRLDGDVIMEKQELVKGEQIELIALTSLEVERIKYRIHTSGSDKKKESLTKTLKIFQKELDRLRNKSIYFSSASSFVNVDALGLDAIDNMLASLGWNEFKIAGLNIRPDAVENMFYSNFSSKHLYSNYDYNYYDAFNLNAGIDICSMGDKDCNPDKELIGGMDFGNMDSLSISQEHGKEFRTLKFLHVLDPLILKDLAKDFVDYYKHHRNKVLRLFYDRAGNNRRNEKTTLAEEFKLNLEGSGKGWKVVLESIGWANIPHEKKRLLWEIILSEKDPRFPYFRVNEPNAKPLVSSLQLAPTYIDSDGNVKKDKRSEKKPLHELPMQSTNASDSIDYPVWGLYKHLLPKVSGSHFYKVSMK